MKRYRRWCLLLAVLAGQILSGAMVVVRAQQNWEKTPYRSWGAADVKAVLESSPWSKVVEQETVVAPMLLGVNAPKAPEKMVVLLRSALPVRQALLRERQLAVKYDKLSEAERAAFDAQNKPLLDCPACGKYYVISVRCNYACYGGSFVEDHKKSFSLVNDKGERRELAGATPLPDARGGVILFFPRLDEKGEPLLTPASRELTFNFLFRTMVNSDTSGGKYKFDVTKMMRSGELLF